MKVDERLGIVRIFNDLLKQLDDENYGLAIQTVRDAIKQLT